MELEGSEEEVDPKAHRAPPMLQAVLVIGIEELEIFIVEPGRTNIGEEHTSNPAERESDGEPYLIYEGETELRIGEERPVSAE